MRLFRFFALLFLWGLVWNVDAQRQPPQPKNDTLEISGLVRDAETREPLPFVNIYLVGGSGAATLSENDGTYTLSFTRMQLADSVEFSFLGYESRRFRVRDVRRQEINVMLSPSTTELQAAVVTAKRRQKIPKDTIAIELWKQVIAHKTKNQVSALESYSYEDYTKIQFNLARVSEKTARNKFLNKHLGVAMQSLQKDYEGHKYLPGMLKETVSDVYYRRRNRAFKRIVKADRLSGFPNETISAFINEQLEEINPYDDVIVVFGKSIPGPFTRGAGTFYRYRMVDTTVIDSVNRHYKMEFVAKRPGDITFLGWVVIDSASFGIVQIDMDIPPNAGINFINKYKVEQRYERIDGVWAQVSGRNMALVHIPERLVLFRLSYDRQTSRRNYQTNIELPDSLFNTDKIFRQDSSYQRSETQWAQMRHDTLDTLETHIYYMVDSIIRTPLFKAIDKFGYFLTSGRIRLGPVDIGRLTEMVSWNSIEGFRFKLGIRTNAKFSKRFQISTYGAYGLRDSTFKYGLAMIAHLNKPGRHWRSLSFQYKFDFELLGQLNRVMSHDNLSAVVSRNVPFNRLMQLRDITLGYTHDWANGLYQVLSLRRRTFYSVPGVFDFTTGPNETPVSKFNTFEVQLLTHWGIGEKFFSDGFQRSTLGTKHPVLEFDYIAGIRGVWGSGYNYHKLTFTLRQRLSSVIGYTNYRLTVGKIFGDAPYPLLTVHLGNQSWFLNRHAFNMMREFEFVSDTYASLWVEHHFDGLLFNTIPGFRRLGWREVVFAKVLYGQLSPHNRQVINVPPTINQPNWYAEVGFGIENIFSLVRVDFMWRLTQRNWAAPNWGNLFFIKIGFEPKF